MRLFVDGCAPPRFLRNMMQDDTLPYEEMVENALRGVVRNALSYVLEHGFPGDHHFYLTFRTEAPGVSVPEFLLDQYPEEMTIVLQHQYWNLTVDDAGFSVTLSFSNRPADLVVPFSAMSAFVDPSVKFGLQFTAAGIDPLQGAREGGGMPALRDTGPLAKIPDNQSTKPDSAEKDAASDKPGDDKAPADTGEAAENASAEVVSLDTFRNK